MSCRQAAPTMNVNWQDLVVYSHRCPHGQGIARNSESALLSSRSSSSSCVRLPAERKRFSSGEELRSPRWTVLHKPSSFTSLRRSKVALEGIWKPLNFKQTIAQCYAQRATGGRGCYFEGLARGSDKLVRNKAFRWALCSYSSDRQDGTVQKDGNIITKGNVNESMKQANPLEEADADDSSRKRVGTGSRDLEGTLRLVETAMFAATAGLAFFLSNLFRLEGYFGCFFPLPVVISSMRWGVSAGRKTTTATALLLLVLSGPVKAASYLLMHGFVGLSVGALWRWRVNWFVSLAICTVVRCFGSLGFVLLTSWILRENLLKLITINAHASISYMLAAVGINIIPTMMMIYVIFGVLLILNCGSYVFLLHVLYVILLKRLGLETNTTAPGWVQRAA